MCSHRRWMEASVVEDVTESGIEIEDKRYSLSIHYRGHRYKARARAVIDGAVSQLRPKPDVVGGKHVINLLPHGAPDKGKALQSLMKRARAQSAFYVGDDVTDESVFSLRDSRIVTVRVGEKKSSRARYFIRAQGEHRSTARTADSRTFGAIVVWPLQNRITHVSRNSKSSVS